MNLKGNLTSKGLQGSIGKSRMQGILGTNPAAIPISVDNALSLSSTNPVQNKVITAAITNRLWSDEVKAALLQIVEKVAYVDEHGQDYYDALYDALYPPTNLDSIGAVFDSSATIYNTDTLDDLKQYLTVTAYYTDGTSETVTTYTLSGSMAAGTQTITVSYGGKTTTFTVTVVALEVTSIDAVFTQGSATIYDTDSLDTLRQYLVVTATYSDSTTAVVTDYTLSGTLTEGTSTITASYGGVDDTFNVVVTDNPLPAEYKQIEYVLRPDSVNQTSGYNTTGVQLNGSDDAEVRIGFMPTSQQQSSSGGYIIGCLEKTNANTIGFCVLVDQDTTQISCWDGTMCTIQPNSGASIRNEKYDVVVTKTTTGMTITDGTTSNNISGETPRTMAKPMYFFGVQKYSGTDCMSPFRGRIYYIKIYENGIAKADLIPCKRISDSAVGFYDIVQNTFRTNANYSAGPEV